MRVCLGFMFLNEASWLRLHLPVMLQFPWDGVVAIDGGSIDDSVDVIAGECARVGTSCVVDSRTWDWDFAAQQNAVIALAEALGFDAMLKWDPDELMFASHLEQAFGLIETGYHKALKFNRINFETDRFHYSPYDYPDMQTRVHVLHEGFAWRGRLHASVNAWDLWREHPNSSVNAERSILWMPHVSIFHYEGLKPIPERWLKWHNYDRIRVGLAPLTTLPNDAPIPPLPVRFTLEYVGSQPLDPSQCGGRAPYECRKEFSREASSAVV